MPIHVDHDERREEIIEAAMRVLGDLGFAKFTIRAVGQRLGGSVTMVTHYYPSRDALLTDMLERTLADARDEQRKILAIEDPHERLEAVVRYFLPLGEYNLAVERARVALSSQRTTEPKVREHLDTIEPEMRGLITAVIKDFIPADRLDAVVDLIRLWTGGMVLATVEHPESWSAERQLEALHHFVELIELPVVIAR